MAARKPWESPSLRPLLTSHVVFSPLPLHHTPPMSDSTPSARSVPQTSRPGSRAAKVQLLIDRSAAAGVLIERTRVQGVAMGDLDQDLLRMEYVSKLDDVRVGDMVVTSGADGVYPKGVPVGQVAEVGGGPGLYQTIHVRPMVAFGDLEDVLVIVAESTASTTAAIWWRHLVIVRPRRRISGGQDSSWRSIPSCVTNSTANSVLSIA